MGSNLQNGTHLVLYDGLCGLCNRLVRFLLLHDRRARFVFAPLQSRVGKGVVTSAGSDPHDLNTFFVFANYEAPDGRVLTRGTAALFIAEQLGWPWKAGVLFRVVPTAVLDRVYDFVATHRYQVFGTLEQCLLPSIEDQKRFVDFRMDGD